MTGYLSLKVDQLGSGQTIDLNNANAMANTNTNASSSMRNQKVVTMIAVNGRDIGISDERSMITTVKDSAKFLLGINNLEEAYIIATQNKKINVTEITLEDVGTENPNKTTSIETETVNLSYMDRIRNASGEITIAGAKMSGVGAFVYGGLCKLGTGLIPLESLTIGDVATTINNLTMTGGSLAYAATKGVVNLAATNVVNSTAVVATTALLYSANSDWQEMSKEKIQDGVNVNGLAHKTKCATKAAFKGGLGVAVGLGTLAYNFWK